MVTNLGSTAAYVGGTGHRPLPTEPRSRRTPPVRIPTGRDWGQQPTTTSRPAPEVLRCRWCRQPSDDLTDDVCDTCRADAEREFHRPTTTPPQEVDPMADYPPYILDIARVMHSSEGHDDPRVRTARKAVANALVGLDRALRTPAPVEQTTQPASTTSTPAAQRGAEVTQAQIREWARVQGLDCNPRGPVRTSVRESYFAAHR